MYDIEHDAEQTSAEQEQERRCGADRQRPFSVWLRNAVNSTACTSEEGLDKSYIASETGIIPASKQLSAPLLVRAGLKISFT